MTGVSTRAFVVLALSVLSLLSAGCSRKKQTVADVGSIAAGDNFDRAMKLLSERQLRQATSVLTRIRFDPQTRGEIEP